MTHEPAAAPETPRRRTPRSAMTPQSAARAIHRALDEASSADTPQDPMQPTLASIKALLRAGADPNYVGADGMGLLHLAITARRPDCLKALLDAGADPDSASRHRGTGMHYAAMAGLPQAVDVLAEAGARSHLRHERNGFTPLDHAVQLGHIDTAARLLHHGADPRVGQLARGGLLHYAARQCNPKLLGLLIEAGLPPNERNGQEQVALHIVARIPGHHVPDTAERIHAMAELLIDAGAQLNLYDHKRETPMRTAALSRNAALIRHLARRGADPNPVHPAADGPLHAALRRSPAQPETAPSLAVVEAILAAGADATCPGAFGHTPAQLAQDHANTGTAELLEAHLRAKQLRTHRDGPSGPAGPDTPGL